MRFGWITVTICVAALALGACDDNPVTDAGVDSGPPVTAVIGTGMTRETLTAVDLTCRGSRTAPTGGANTSFTLTVEDFLATMDPEIEGIEIQFFPDNNVSLDGTCTGTCVSTTSGTGGIVAASSLTDQWYGYRVVAGDGLLGGIATPYVQVIQYNEPAPADAANVNANAISVTAQGTITALLNIEQNALNGIITGQHVDCNGAPIANARVRIFDSSGAIAFGTARTDTKGFYFSGAAIPAAREMATHVDGLYGVGNVPIPTDATVRVELWGVVTDGGAEEMIGCEEIQVVEAGVTIINIGPTRSDGPTNCSG